MAKESAAKTPAANSYYKEQLVQSSRYFKRRDLLNALLTDGEQYTLEEVDAAIENYMKGKVE